MHSMALPLQPIVNLQPMPLLKRIPVEVIPVEHTARRVEGALIEGALLTVGSSMSRGRVRRPMTSSGPPPMQTPRSNGTPLPAQTGAATCASRIPIPCAVTGTKRHAHPPKNERRSSLTLSPPMRGFSFAGRSAVWLKMKSAPLGLRRGFLPVCQARTCLTESKAMGRR
jgi:hypothetical protein